MRKVSLLNLVLFASVVILLYFLMRKESGHNRIVSDLKRDRKLTADSVQLFRNKSQYWKDKYLEAFTEYGKAKREGSIWESRAAYLREENEILKSRKPVRYSDRQLDSLLVARYPR